MRVLIADDDPVVAQALPPRLRREGHRVTVRSSASGLVETAQDEGSHLVVLDPALAPAHEAADLSRALRNDTAALLLLLGRPADVAERVRMLEAGADDYLANPAATDEVLARVRALLRRHPLHALALAGRGDTLLRLTETLWLDLAGQRLVPHGGPAGQPSPAGARPLSDREFRLLAHLVRHDGMVLTREALLQAVWGPGYEGSTREVDVYVRFLRRKLEPDPAHPRYLVTA